jgi:dipeptidyl aminopeptidase/acylaminoacyl peptidase
MALELLRDAGHEIFTSPGCLIMSRTFLSVLFFLYLSAFLLACGGGSKTVIVPQPQVTNAFMFLQEVPNQGATFTPMVGQYTITGNTVTFEGIPAQDQVTGQITSGDFGSVSLSTTSNKVAFDLWGGIGSTLVDQWDIYVGNADGSTTQITNDSYEDSYPQLSSDGKKVVFTSLRQGANGPNSIVVRSAVNPLAPEQVLPMPPGATNVWDPTFSPDGSMIAVEASDYDGVNTTFHGIVLMNADGSNPQLITNPYSATCDCWDGFPAFTPDGNQILFTAATNTTNGSYLDIYITNLDGSGTAPMSDGVGYNVDPLVIDVPGMARKIVFQSDRDNMSATASTGYELYAMNMDGTGLVRLTNNALFDGFSQEWFVAQGSAAHARAAIDARRGHNLEVPAGQRLLRGFKW